MYKMKENTRRLEGELFLSTKSDSPFNITFRAPKRGVHFLIIDSFK